MHARNDINDPREVRSDVAAHVALERRVGRGVTDAEWAVARGKFMEFANILRGWDRKTSASGLGNVEVLCQREP